jgi:hypothetical protein
MGTEVPERHDLTLFPTVNDLKNQIHQALVDVENGTLAVTSPQVGRQTYNSLRGLSESVITDIRDFLAHLSLAQVIKLF